MEAISIGPTEGDYDRYEDPSKRIRLERLSRFQELVRRAVLMPNKALSKVITAFKSRYLQAMSLEDFTKWVDIMAPYIHKAKNSPLTRERYKEYMKFLLEQRDLLKTNPPITVYRKLGRIEGGIIVQPPTFTLHEAKKLWGRLQKDPLKNIDTEALMNMIDAYHTDVFRGKGHTEITLENVQAAFHYIANRKDIPWGYCRNGCAQRAEMAKSAFLALGFPLDSLQKVAINLNQNETKKSIWKYHTALAIILKNNTQLILDPTLNPNQPMTQSDWVASARENHAFDDKDVNIIQSRREGISPALKKIVPGAGHTLYIFHPDQFLFALKGSDQFTIRSCNPLLTYRDIVKLREFTDYLYQEEAKKTGKDCMHILHQREE